MNNAFNMTKFLFRKTKKAKSFLKKESKKEIALLQYYVNVYNLDIS